jgi:GNAT superfamily N-acetyltransferase
MEGPLELQSRHLDHAETVIDAPRMLVRDATIEDAEAIAVLWDRYLREHYGLTGKVDAAILRRDAFSTEPRFRMVLAFGSGGDLRGAVAWNFGHDLHHFVRGVDVHDLYVAPEHRGIGVAVALLAHVAKLGVEGGAEYMRGNAAVEPTPGRRLYDRVCVFFPGDTANLSASAFRRLASLAGADPREFCRQVPPRELNFV